MYDRNAIRLSLVHMLPIVADRYGAAVRPLLAGAGIADGDAAWDDRIVARAQVCTLLRNLARSAGETTIGIDLAAAADPHRLGLSGLAMLSGRTLRECFLAHARHMPSLQQGVRMVLREHQARASWVHRLDSSDPEASRVLNEGIAAFVVHAIRAILGDDIIPIHVTLPHRPMVPVQHYEDKLKTAVSFVPGQDIVIGFDAALLGRPNALLSALPARAAELLDAEPRPVAEETSVPGDDDLILSLHRIIEISALSGALSLRDAACTLGLSPRGMQRRLATLGVTFEALVDDWRHETARTCLADPELRIATVAGRLGYADAAHFIRAFRRWEGVSPTAFREANVADRAG